MRPIKFRGKRVDNGEWVYGNLLYDKDQKNAFIVTGYWWVKEDDTIEIAEYKVIPETVGQFTGLSDKNGKEIYDGDRWLPDYNGLFELIVEFSGGQFNVSRYMWLRGEIIGNVHEDK